MSDMTTATGEAAEAGQVLAGVFETEAADASVRVQDDLFRHVNGTWLKTAPIPADKPGTGSFLVLRDAAEAACREILDELAQAENPDVTTPSGKLAALYSSFMDEDHIEALGAAPLESEIDPIRSAGSKDELAKLLGGTITSGFTGGFSVMVENDPNNPDRYTTWIGQAGIGLPDESYYREEAHAAIREAYVDHIATMLTLAGITDEAGACDAATRVMALETNIARGHWDRVKCRDIEAMNNPRSWEAVVGSAPAFPWEVWKSGVEQAAQEAGAPLGEFLLHTIVEQPDYLPHFATTWEAASLDDLKLWALWHVVSNRAGLLSGDFATESFEFYSKRLQGIDQQRPRWKRGVSLVEGCLGEALGELYVAKHFPPSHKEAMEVLVADLIEAYRQSISELDWMGEETRARALEKLSQFTPKIGYPQIWRNYSPVVVTPGDVVASVRSVESFDFARALKKLAGPVDRDEWHMTPQTVNAYYSPLMNEIVFPAAILQSPFFDPQADAAVNYAGIGAVIGHEIGHGFDDQGSTFDGTGKVTDWWTEADREAFKARTGALIAQYDAFQPSELLAKAEREGSSADDVPHVNGALTIGENIGDLGGLGIALKAYKLALAREGIESVEDAPVIDGLSAMERFFFSWARIWRGKNRDERAELLLTIDPHSPAEFRCNGIVRNMDAFYEAFEVREGDAMWLDPAQRVTIW